MTRLRVFLRRLQRAFVTTVIGGVVVVLPLAIFISLVRFIVGFMRPLLLLIGDLLPIEEAMPSWVVDGLSLAIVITLFFLLGLLVRTRSGKSIINWLETQLLSRIPFYKPIRDTVQQFTGGKKMPFQKVVLVDVFGNDTRMTGFLTDELGDDKFTVFVPTGPNPTNGFIFHVSGSQITHLDTKPEDAMRSIIGVGAGSGKLFGKEE